MLPSGNADPVSCILCEATYSDLLRLTGFLRNISTFSALCKILRIAWNRGSKQLWGCNWWRSDCSAPQIHDVVIAPLNSPWTHYVDDWRAMTSLSLTYGCSGALAMPGSTIIELFPLWGRRRKGKGEREREGEAKPNYLLNPWDFSFRIVWVVSIELRYNIEWKRTAAMCGHQLSYVDSHLKGFVLLIAHKKGVCHTLILKDKN